MVIICLLFLLNKCILLFCCIARYYRLMSIISVNIMSLQKLHKKIEHYPEMLGIILFFGLMMIQPVSEQYLYQVFSEKHGVPYNFNNNKTGCPSTNNSNTNVSSSTHQVRRFSISFDQLYSQIVINNFIYITTA